MCNAKTAAIRKIDGHIFCWMDKPIQNLTRGHPVAIYIRKEQFGLQWDQSDDPSLEMLLIGRFDSSLDAIMNSLLGGGCIHSAGISLWEMQNFKLQPFRKHPFWAEMLHRKDYQVGIPPRHEVETFQSTSPAVATLGSLFLRMLYTSVCCFAS